MGKFLPFVFFLLILNNVFGQDESDVRVHLYGHVMTDAGYNFNQIHPDFYDVMRPTQLPSYENEYGTDGNVFFSARQSYFGLNSYIPTELGELMIQFSFDLFGVGPNTGQTTFHMLYAYAEIGMLGIGHTWSLFSDINGYPNIIEYWGPTGMSLCKNVQIRFIPLKGKDRLAIALERPGASADEGIYEDRIELDDVKSKFNLPDLTAEYRMTRKWGYVELAGVVRKIEWIDQDEDPFDLSDKALGWGLNLSTNLNLGENTMLIGQTALGEASQNFMNDAPTDIALQRNSGNLTQPVKLVALPYSTFSLYFNHSWNEKFSSVIGYSAINTRNTDGQEASAFRNGRYASTNLLFHPIPNISGGVELQWIQRENYNDDWKTSAFKIQFSVKYRFDHVFNMGKK